MAHTEETDKGGRDVQRSPRSGVRDDFVPFTGAYTFAVHEHPFGSARSPTSRAAAGLAARAYAADRTGRFAHRPSRWRPRRPTVLSVVRASTRAPDGPGLASPAAVVIHTTAPQVRTTRSPPRGGLALSGILSSGFG